MHLTKKDLLQPELRQFPSFDASRLLETVFKPLGGCKIGLLIDLEDPKDITDFAFLGDSRYEPQQSAYENFYLPLNEGLMEQLDLTGGDIFAYHMTGGSNLDMRDPCFDKNGQELSLERDIYPNYDILLCMGTWSATAPLTAMSKKYGFRGATMHGLNDVILSSGLAVNYEEVSEDTEKIRLALTRADTIEIDFELENGSLLTAELNLESQEAQKSHGLCQGSDPDVANLPAGEVYFVPRNAQGEFPMKYEDGTLGRLVVEDRSIISAHLLEGNQSTIDEHNERLKDDPMTGTLGELGFGTQVLPVSYSDIQDEKVLGTCHLATGRDDHLGGDIVPSMFKKHENSTHDDILFAPHKTPNFNLKEVRMIRGDQKEILIQNFKPASYMIDALLGKEGAE